MSAASDVCQLCLNSCDVGFYKWLHEDFEVYRITTKYFDLSSLNMDDLQGAICLECCGLMTDFYDFQNRVIKAHENLKIITTQKENERKERNQTPECIGDNRNNSMDMTSVNYQEVSSKSNDRVMISPMTQDVEYIGNSVLKPCRTQETIRRLKVQDKIKETDCPEADTTQTIPLLCRKIKSPESHYPQSVPRDIQRFEYDNNGEDVGELISLATKETGLQQTSQSLEDSDVVKKEFDVICLSDEELPTSSTRMDISEEQKDIGEKEDFPIALQCIICQDIFRIRTAFQRHVREKHPNEKAIFCSRKVHLPNEGYTSCVECRLIVNSFKRVRTKDSQCYYYKCQVCMNICSKEAAFRHHMSVHSGAEPYKCRKCSLPIGDL